MLKFEEISPSEFFYRNKEIAGFENPTKACYTIVRELVENSLDACEIGGILPDIKVIIDEIGDGEENKIIKIKVKDNGIGIPKENVPYAFGKVLYGSKFALRQHRGIFGLGGKMAILYGQITTNSPVQIFTSTLGNKLIHFFEMKIDILKNEPNILRYETLENREGWHGLIIEFKFLGNYYNARKKILEYLFQTSILIPYMNLIFIDNYGSYIFKRKSTLLPKIPEETPLHPKGIDLEMLKRLISLNKKENLKDFLVKNFQKIGNKTAEDIINKLNLNLDLNVRRLKDEEIIKLYNIFKSYNFKKPSATSLSPVGENFVIGIKEIFTPEFVAYNSRKPSSYEGHPFIVETAIAYGGNIPVPVENEINLFRFANKIPLIYDSYNDVSMKVIKQINWNIYKIDIYKEPVAFFVHVCSTKIPYKTLGKEYIANVPELAKEIELSIRKNARKLSVYLNKKRLYEYQKIRYSYLKEYLEKIFDYACKLGEVEIKKVNLETIINNG
jgi:DNA topoisomerase-6 subunit B